MIIVGLTGSIGMGKSTTAQMFRESGIPVFDADAEVHSLYAKGGKAVPLIRAVYPDAIIDGAVDRQILGRHVLPDPIAMDVLESFIHEWVGDARALFMEQARASGADMIVFDIPLLFETGGDKRMDKIVVVTAPESVQRERVLSRSNMTPAKFEAIKSRQTPDHDKRKNADYLIWTDKGLDYARTRVKDIIQDLRRGT